MHGGKSADPMLLVLQLVVAATFLCQFDREGLDEAAERPS
jgi:hypothetical protein